MFSILLMMLFIISIALTYVYRQDIAMQVTQKINQTFKTEFEYQNFRFNYITKLGELTLSFEDVKFSPKDSNKVSSNSIAEIEQLHFAIDFSAILQGNYEVQKIYIENAQIHLESNTKKQANYDDVWDLEMISSSSKMDWKVAEYQLINIKVVYINPQENYSFNIQKLKGNSVYSQSASNFEWNGNLSKFKFQAQNQVFWEEKEIPFSGKTTYNPSDKSIKLTQANFKLKETAFSIEGDYQIRSSKVHQVAFTFRGVNQDLSQLFAFLPEAYYKEWQGFASYGQVNFKGLWQGRWTRELYPNLEIDFSGQNIAINSKHNVRRSIEQLNFKGKFNNGDKNNLQTSSLRIDNISGIIGNRRFQGDFYLSNLLRPYVALNAEAGIDLAYWQEFYPMKDFQEIKGLLGFKVNFDGEWSEIKADKEPYEKKITLGGQLELANASFKFRNNPLEYQALNIRLNLVNNQAQIQQGTGKIGQSDFNLKGELLNLPSYLLDDSQSLIVNGVLNAHKIQLEELLQKALTGLVEPNPVQPSTTGYLFQAPERLELYVSCLIDSIVFRKFAAAQISGDIALKEKVFRTGNLNLNMAGGVMNFLGICNAQKEDFVRFDGRVILIDAEVEQVFYAFEDFSQQFIQSKNISGRVDTDIKGGLVFDRNLEIQFEHLVADVDSRTRNGELKDLVLMKDIARKVQATEIANLKFKEMKNIIQVRNQTIFIPETEIKTDNPTLSIIGRATLDKGLDYKIKVPLRQTFVNPQASAVLQNGNEVVYYLSVKGKAQNFRVSFMDISDKTQLEEHWNREKKSYLNLFKKTSLSDESFPVDTVKISYFN